MLCHQYLILPIAMAAPTIPRISPAGRRKMDILTGKVTTLKRGIARLSL
jgi:hypothetical protein